MTTPALEPSSDPRPVFYDSVVKCLGRLTALTAGAFLPATAVTDAVLLEHGYDPAQTPLQPGVRPRGLREAIDLAFWRLKEGHRGKRPALTVSGPNRTWGLTPEGIDHARTLLPPPPPAKKTRVPFPAEAQQERFYDPVIKVIGLLTSCKPGSYAFGKEVVLGVLREVGLDPDHLPEGLTFKGRRGLGRRVQLAFRNQRAGYRAVKVALTQQGDGHMLWGLTPEGIEKAKALCNEETESEMVVLPKNLTSKWLDAHYHEVYPTMLAAIRRRMIVSTRAGLAEDHLQGFFLKLVSRDGLASRIQAGQSIPATWLASCVVKSAITDIRDWGCNPVTREILGARTDQERRRATLEEAESVGVVAQTASQVVYMKQDGMAQLLDVRDESAFLDAEQRATFAALWSRVGNAVRAVKPLASPRYVHLYHRQLMGDRVEEIAKQEGISGHRVASMLHEVRQAIQAAKERGEFDEFAPY